ncbi:MAG: 2-octaprenyl-6-methoxyphenyl hydroxylase [Colwellia sp.]|jgi:2-octaprenyl-6-methoxyphenol hydroxylase|nr:2-octaprenyl-6-methoxyphenyl hydroxylase [Colwellia sp.]
MINNKKNFDIIISGGGLSGSLMALSLADLTKADGSLLSIAIIETNKPEANESEITALAEHKTTQHHNTPPLFDDRVLALSHASAKYFDSVDVWQHLSADACPIEKIDISDRGHYGKARIEAQEYGVSALGYVIAMAKIGQGQLTALASKKNVQWFCPDTITDINWQVDNELATEQDTGLGRTIENTKGNTVSITEDNNVIELTLSSENRLQTSLLLACDGANSPCRQLANIEVNQSDYQQVALIANVATKQAHSNKAFERFTEFGPIAMLPLVALKNDQHRCSLVWTMSAQQGKQLLAFSDDEFSCQLELAFGSWLGAITQVGKRDVYPLVLLQAKQQTYHRLALIGNAAHTIHPIAGQGFNLGLRDVQLMASLIAKQLKNQADLGSFALLNEYSQQREQDQKQIITLTDSLVTLFANNLPPLVAGRNAGLKIMNYLQPLKSTLVNKLMGY